MESGAVYGEEDGEHTGVGLVDIFKMFVMRDAVFFGRETFYRVLDYKLSQLARGQDRSGSV